MKRGKKIKEVKQQKRSKTGLILALIALAILALNVIMIFTSSQWIIDTASQSGVLMPTNMGELLMTYGVLWLVLAIVTIMLIMIFENRKVKAWWLMLILGIVVIITSRIESGILLIIASVFYKKVLL